MLCRYLFRLSIVCLALLAHGSGALAVCGDFNGDSNVNLTDVTLGLNYLYINGVPPSDFDQADCDNHQLFTPLDLLILTDHLYIGFTPLQCPPALAAISPTTDSRTTLHVTPASLPAGDSVQTVQLFFESSIPVNFLNLVFVVEIDGAPAPSGSLAAIRWGARHDEMSPILDPLYIDSTLGAVNITLGSTINELAAGTYGMLAEIDIELPPEDFSRDITLSWTTFGPQQGGQDANYTMVYDLATDSAVLPTILYDQVCGNFDLDPAGVRDLNDQIAAQSYLILGGAPPRCYGLADCDGYELYTMIDFMRFIWATWYGGAAVECPPANSALNPTPVTHTYLDVYPSEILATTPRRDTIMVYFANDVPVESFVFPLSIEVDGQPLPPGSIVDIVAGTRMTGFGQEWKNIYDAGSGFFYCGGGTGNILTVDDNDLLFKIVIDFPASPDTQDILLSWTTFGPDQYGQAAIYPVALSIGDGVIIEPDIGHDLCCHGRAGDVNYDGLRDLGDILMMADKIYNNPPPPWCDAVANTNGDAGCVTDMDDILWLAGAIFLGGPPIEGCILDCE